VDRIEYVVPNGFRGTVIIRHQPDAPGLPVVDGRYVFNIPEDGVFVYGGYDPLRHHLRTARFANGDQIWVSTRGDSPENGEVALLGEVTRRTWNSVDGYGVPEYRIFIGTEKQWKNRTGADR
jgi:hypothetical protein